MPDRTAPGFIVFVRVEYSERQPDLYVVPLGWAIGDRAIGIQGERADHVIARVKVSGRSKGKGRDDVSPAIVGRPATFIRCRPDE